MPPVRAHDHRVPYPSATSLVSAVVLQRGDVLVSVPLDQLRDEDGPSIVGIVMGGAVCLIDGVAGEPDTSPRWVASSPLAVP